VTAPGDGEVTVVPDETLGEQDPLLAKLLAAATVGAAPAGPVTKRQPGIGGGTVRLVDVRSIIGHSKRS
jgi:hypothetical protein